MCSIFHNRINYRGPRSGSAGTTSSGSASNEPASIVKDDPDRNNNSGGDEPQTRFQIHHSDDDDDRDDEQQQHDGGCVGEKALDLSVMSRLPATGHVALEALQHTKVAVAQFAATAIANTQNFDEAVNDLAVVQSTIFNVQRQQLMQMQLIQHLQSKLKHRTDDDYEDDNDDEPSTVKEEPDGRDTPPQTNDPIPEKEKTDTLNEETTGREPTPTECAKPFQPELCDISSSFASSIITNHDPPPPPNEPNCLEMLQRRTEEVLDSASQSVHASHLNDEYDYSRKDGQGRGEIFKHRCKYCGKIFGSYSALQIHLRSHTGERPFQCNVCGSKFTTKGNLKVHYQRHTQIFPPMLMPPSSNVEQYHHHPGIGPHGNPPPPPPPLRLPFPSFVHMSPFHHMGTSPNQEKEPPPPVEKRPEPQSQPQPQPTQTEAQDLRKTVIDSEDRVHSTEDKPKKEPAKRLETPIPPTPPAPDNRRKRSSTSRDTHSITMKSVDENFPENLSKSSRRSSLSRGSVSSLEQIPSEYSLAQMERLIDKSWEDLIEIDKTSETSKLQQLVDNIENKLTDPNQCIFCQKVMSCRSSLQMHLRTHTGERPFRCKICGRAFATKGNLKAHMSIHKIKPPMRSQFKCPVCHQKFSNGIILQQHIRIHTIDDGDAHDRAKANEMCNIEDQSSTRSISTSDNMDFSQSEYSGQRSESSQGDFDDFTMASEEESAADGTYEERRDDHKGSEGGSNSDENCAIDLSAKGTQDNDRNSDSAASSTGVSLVPNFLLMPRDNRSPPKFPLLPFGPFGLIAGLRGVANICNICFRIFPSASELDTHIRSHTKEDNFKCSICDKGCVTKEEFHNHLLAHRFHRDVSDSNNQNSINLLNDDSQSDNRQFKTDVINLDNEKPLSPNGVEANSSIASENHIGGDAEHSLMKMQLLSSLPNESHIRSSTESSRFTSNQQDIQQNSQDQPANNKHFCTVCRRNFSSSSALQIHMRTHTGDKPFQCNVCQKAFTTKGNLKVHMGTHMWTNPASRRGRRMSLELPMHRPNLLPLGAHQDSEILTRRPEIFFPYLPPFFNGLQPKPMDVSSGSFPGLPPSPFPNGASQKYSDLIGFAPFLGPPYNFPPLPSLDRQMAKSPVDESHSQSPQRSSSRGSTPQHHQQYNQLPIKKDYHNDEYVKG